VFSVVKLDVVGKAVPVSSQIAWQTTNATVSEASR
jgi:hypothetical protein